MEQSGTRFHHTNSEWCNLKHEVFISGIFYLIFSESSVPRVTEIVEKYLKPQIKETVELI